MMGDHLTTPVTFNYYMVETILCEHFEKALAAGPTHTFDGSPDWSSPCCSSPSARTLGMLALSPRRSVSS
jgi:hypothetical protein